MNKVVMTFPDTICMAEFILMVKPSRVETLDRQLKGKLTDQQIEYARKHYRAVLKSSVKITSRK